MAGQLGQTADDVFVGGGLDHLQETEKADIQSEPIGKTGLAISANDAAARRGEEYSISIHHGFGAVDAICQFGNEAGLAQKIQLEGEERLLEARGG